MKKIFLFASVLVLTLSSCSSSDDSSPDPANMLVKSFTSNDEDGVLKTNVTYNGNKIVKMFDSDGYRAQFTYTGNLITRIDSYVDDNLEQRDNFTYDSSGRVLSYQMLDYGSETGDLTTFEYNADGTVSTELFVGDLDNQTMLNNTGTIYFTNGEVSKIEKYFDGTLASTSLYTYDTKNNPFKNITGFSAISFTDGDASGILHNVLTNVYEGSSSTFAMTYNSSDYPTKIVETEGSTIASTVDIVYQ